MKNITSKVVLSGVWSYLRISFSSIFHLGVMAILARILDPKDFGIVALASVILRVLIVLGEEGFSQYIIYYNGEEEEKKTYAAFWLNCLFSISASILAFALLPFVGRIYDEPEIKKILTLLIVRFLVESFSYIPDALLKKKLDFKKLEARNLIVDFVSGILSVIMALEGYGVWSLVVPSLVLSPTRFIISSIALSWFPKFSFYTESWKEIFNYSKHLIGATVTTLFLTQGDTILIGKLLDIKTLGIYNLAFRNASMVVKNLTRVANKISFPAFSLVNKDLKKIYQGWVRLERFLATISFFILTFLFVFAEEFILGVYGEKWIDSIIPFRILLIFFLRLSVGNIAQSIFRTVGRTDLSLKLGLIVLPFYLGGIYIGSFWGIIGVASGVTLVRTSLGMINFYLVGKCLNESFLSIVKPLFRPLQNTLYFASGLVFFKYIVLETVSNPLFENFIFRLIVSFLYSIVLYFFLIRTFFPELRIEIYRVLEPLLGKRKDYFARVLKIEN